MGSSSSSEELEFLFLAVGLSLDVFSVVLFDFLIFGRRDGLMVRGPLSLYGSAALGSICPWKEARWLAIQEKIDTSHDCGLFLVGLLMWALLRVHLPGGAYALVLVLLPMHNLRCKSAPRHV